MFAPDASTLLISRVSAAGEALRGEADPGSWQRLRDAGCHLDGAHVDLLLQRFGEVVVADGTIAVRGTVRCERCLGFMPWAAEIGVRIGMAESEAAVGKVDPELDPVLSCNGVLDLQEWLEEEVLLALPMVSRCAESGAGCCPVSGVEVPARGAVPQNEERR